MISVSSRTNGAAVKQKLFVLSSVGGDGQMFCKCVITSRKCESCTDVPVCWGNKADLFLHLLLQLEFLVLSVIESDRTY